MKCHYEVLNVARDADDNDLKKAYRKLALKWHPDKNPTNEEEAKEQFQIIQQAYEVLSDPHERSWYNNHREAILKGGLGDDYKDDSIDLFQYFTSGCYKGDGDDDKGFYSVYRRVFETLAAEDAEYGLGDDSDESAPTFGDSQSDYDRVVHNFYAYWQSYSTKRSFAWLDPYNIRETPNRRVSRVAEKLNKKVRDKAKRERNEQVRNLVAFIRKRDKRVKAHAEKLAKKAQLNAAKAQERKRNQMLERQRELKESKVSEWSKFSNIESELKNIEANLAAEFGEAFSDSCEDDDDDKYDDRNLKDSDALYCVACNKIFKTQKAFANHENSKKHRDNLSTMRKTMRDEDNDCRTSDDDDDDSSSSSDLETKNAAKLATDSQMPDFLLNPENNKTKNNDEQNETSNDELNSDSDENSEKLTNGHNLNDGGAKNVEDGGYLFPEASSMTKNDDEMDETSPEELCSDDEDAAAILNIAKKKKKTKKMKNINTHVESDEEEMMFDVDVGLSKKQRRKKQNFNDSKKSQKNSNVDEESNRDAIADVDGARGDPETTCVTKKSRGKKTKEIKAARLADSIKQKSHHGKKDNKKDVSDNELCCVTCKCEFPSKNKLFDHLKKTGHSVYLPSTTKTKKKTGDKRNRGRARSESDDS